MPYQQGGNISFGGAPFTGEEEEQGNPYQLSPYLSGASPQIGQIPGISDYFSSGTPPINGRPPVEEMPPQGDEMSPPPQDPLMSELDRAKDWRGGAAIGLGAALGGMFGGTGAASASGAVAQSGQQHMLEALQQSRQLQAKDRENRFRLSEEKIQGAEKMMSELHGVDMAGMPDHVKQEMTRLTQLYNQKLQGGLTEKEATEVLAMGARMQQLMQEAKADPTFATTQGRMAGEAERAKQAGLTGADPADPTYHGESPAQLSMMDRARETAKARVRAAEIAASAAQDRLGRQLEVAEIRAGNAAVQAYVSQNNAMGDTMLDQDLLNEIFLNGVARARQAVGHKTPVEGSAQPTLRGKSASGSTNASRGNLVHKNGVWEFAPSGIGGSGKPGVR